jgi:hypothetical protein
VWGFITWLDPRLGWILSNRFRRGRREAELQAGLLFHASSASRLLLLVLLLLFHRFSNNITLLSIPVRLA